jgi:hypothetical protein
MHFSKILMLVGMAVSCAANAEDPAPPPAAPATATAAPAASAPAPTAAAVPAPAATVDAKQAEADAKKAAAEEKIKKYGFGSYKPEVFNGKTVYCRKEVSLGSHFESKVCRTYDQLLADQRTGKDYVQQLQVQSAPPKN